MSLKLFRPITPSSRGTVLIDRKSLYKGSSFKALTTAKRKTGGRNNRGIITVRHHGGGHKQKYRMIDFKRQKFDVTGKVERIEYDPNRTAFIALIQYEDKEYSYILAPEKLKVGDSIVSGAKVDVMPGNAMPLSAMPIGSVVHNVELLPKGGGKLARSAGTYIELVGRDMGYAQLKLKSGEVRRVLENCMATIGSVSNSDKKNTKLGKAGRKRWLGIRPSVRGVAMNPVDHPLGGGEGKSSGGRHPVSPWGLPAKGKKTRNNSRTQKMIIRGRKANKRRKG